MNPNVTSRNFRNKARGFSAPAQLPETESDAREWQSANREWWERSPMRYDWRASIDEEPGSKAYYAEIDRRFLESVRHYLPWTQKPFESLIPYAGLSHMDVLEIGVGQGTHAQLIAPDCKSFTGIDLTESACTATRTRFALHGLQGRVEQMDAEAMQFADETFDLVWSWGVIHHSANTANVLREMRRVLRPGGRATVMVYFRSPIQYYLISCVARGLLRGEFWTVGSIHKINQAATDGALARYFSIPEFRALTDGLFVVDRIKITGQKTDAFPLPAGRLKTFLHDVVPDPASRFLTDTLRLGIFLIAEMRRA